MTPTALRWATYWCYFVAICLAGMKLLFAYWWWFEGIWFWSEAYRPFPDWGQGAEQFGALLPAKWIGTRNLGFALILLAGLAFAVTGRGYKLLGFVLLQGVLVEFFDGLWLAYGKFNAGWEGPNTDFYMTGGFLWFPFSLTAGMFLLSRDALERRAALGPAAAAGSGPVR